MSRYLNFYFSPYEIGERRHNFQTLYLLESDCVKTPTLKKPFMGGGIDDDVPDYQNGIFGVVFDTTTVPPTLVKDYMGTAFCAKFNHPGYPKFCIYKGVIRETATKRIIMEGADVS